MGTFPQLQCAGSGDVLLGTGGAGGRAWLKSPINSGAADRPGRQPYCYVAFPSWCLIGICSILPVMAVCGGSAGEPIVLASPLSLHLQLRPIWLADQLERAIGR